jgi:hypothetical protein
LYTPSRHTIIENNDEIVYILNRYKYEDDGDAPGRRR